MSRNSSALTAVVMLVILLAFAPAAYAEDTDWLENPYNQIADLLAKAAELDARRAEVTALKATVAAQDAQIKAQAALITTQDAMLARQARITALADEERDLATAGRQRDRAEISKATLWLRVQARGGMLGLACTPFALAAGPFAPAVPIACAGIGGLVGLVEHWLSD